MGGPRVKISQGELEGCKRISKNGIEILSFQGIPYAKPPVGSLRFKDPLPAENWYGVYSATKERNICPQLDSKTKEITGEEDCLFLNIYTPKISKKLLPVMLWVHGGAFIKNSGTSNSYGPDFIVEKDVVMITMNYRFTVLGFLCLHNENAPGNAGLKDVIMALKWIKSNIKNFGGNPDNVTLFGQSAGAAIVQYLTLSSSAEKLFHKAIIQSGSALCTWAQQRDPITNAVQLATDLGSQSKDLDEVYKFLQKVPYQVLVKTAIKTLSALNDKHFLPGTFLPVVEKQFEGIENVLTENPEVLLRTGKFRSIPMMLGYASKESVFMFERINFEASRICQLIDDFHFFIPLHMNVPRYSERSTKLSKSIKEYYFKDKAVTKDTLYNGIELISDFGFKRPVDASVKYLVNTSRAPVFYYEFCYFGLLNQIRKGCELLNVDEASHSDDNCYIFVRKIHEDVIPTEQDVIMRNRMTEMWTNFAKNGDPSPTSCGDIIWKPATKECLNYMEIDERLTLGTDPNKDAMMFWESIEDS